MNSFKALIKSLFISGILTILPLTITIAIFMFLVRKTSVWASPIYNILPESLKVIPFSGVIAAIILIIGIGAIMRFFILRSLVEAVERMFHKVPLVSQVYFGIKQLINALGPKDKQHFQQVVLIEFPRRGSYSLGFLTSECHSALISGRQVEGAPQDEVFYNVFVPHTPNPTGGFFLIIPKSQCTLTNLSRQEAMTIIISGGVIMPERFTKECDQ